MTVTTIHTSQELEQNLAEFQFVVLDCMASWCGPCKAIAPKIHDLASQFRQVRFLKIDVQEAPDLSDKYHVTGLPTFLFFIDGVLQAQSTIVGANVALLTSTLRGIS